MPHVRRVQSDDDDNDTRSTAHPKPRKRRTKDKSLRDESRQLALDLYDSLKPTVFVCPFADPSRMNLCTALPENPKRTKEVVTRHLRSVLEQEGDACHSKRSEL